MNLKDESPSKYSHDPDGAVKRPWAISVNLAQYFPKVRADARRILEDKVLVSSVALAVPPVVCIQIPCFLLALKGAFQGFIKTSQSKPPSC